MNESLGVRSARHGTRYKRDTCAVKRAVKRALPHTAVTVRFCPVRAPIHTTLHRSQALLLKPWFPEALCNLVHTYQFISDWTDHATNMKLVEQV